MLEQLITLDKNWFVFLNGLGSEPFDSFWKIITKQFYWTPFFIGVFYLLQQKLGWKKTGILLLFVAVLITITDQTTNFVKHYFHRLRPCNDLSIKNSIRIVIHRSSYSFFSGHASNSMATSVFLFFVLKKYYNYAFLIFFFPLLFAYSRIYLGLHFPLDIFSGYLFGIIIGCLFFRLFQFILKKKFSSY